METDKADVDVQTFQMVALDLDGTLLQSNHQIADEQVEYLRQLTQDGFRVCIATGRAPPSVYEHVKKLALPGQSVPVVCSNGARGFLLSFPNNEQAQRQELFYTPVGRDVVIQTLQLAKQLGVVVQYYLADGIYANPTTDGHRRLLKLYSEATQSEIIEVPDDFASLMGDASDEAIPGGTTGLPSKLLIRCEEQDYDRIEQAFYNLFGRSSATDPRPQVQATIIPGYSPRFERFLEILDPSVNKGDGLAHMCQSLGVDLRRVVAMGDGTNDVEFLTMAGLGVAMNNAHETLQRVADYTMEWTNDQHGVTKTMEKLRLEGRLEYTVR